jgi:hypothetical protein
VLLDAVDPSDADADAVVQVLLPKVQQRSGPGVYAFHTAVNAILPFRPTGPLQ